MYELQLIRGWALIGFYNAHNLLNSNVYELRRQKRCEDKLYSILKKFIDNVT
jgi:hypothetical protein